jgi:hypothetical protein
MRMHETIEHKSGACVHTKVDVVGADAGGQGHLQLGRVSDDFGSDVGGVERLRDDDVCVLELFTELTALSFQRELSALERRDLRKMVRAKK